MDLKSAHDFYTSITMIECREQLLMANTVGFPHKKKSKQTEFIKKLEHGMAEHLENQGREILTTEDMYYDLIRKLGG